MANNFLTPELIAQQALANLYANLVMVPLVYTDISSQFAAQKPGNTINIRKPTTFTAEVFDDTSGVVVQSANETAIPVTLNTIADVTFAITTEQLTLDIVSFDEQLLTPACMAIAEQVDQSILSLRSGITNYVGLGTGTAGNGTQGFDNTVADTIAYSNPQVLINSNAVLDSYNVPSDGRHAVIGAGTKAQWLTSSNLINVLNSGDNQDLRKGSLGTELFGNDIYVTTNVTPGTGSSGPSGTPKTEVDVAFHETAFCFASAPLELAPGSFASVQTYNGLSIRIAYQYDLARKRFLCSLDTLYGVKVLDANRACLIGGGTN